MDYKSIQELIKAVSESNLSFFEVESDGIHVKMEKKTEQVLEEKVVQTAAASEQSVKELDTNKAAYIETVKQVSKEEIISEVKVPDSNEAVVTSPIVGTVYLSSSPSAQAFVQVGSKVKKGDVLCIIEAMKLMNEIESEVDGEVMGICVTEEQMVEYGQPLFRIKA